MQTRHFEDLKDKRLLNRGSSDGARYVLITTGCTEEETAAALLAYLLFIREE